MKSTHWLEDRSTLVPTHLRPVSVAELSCNPAHGSRNTIRQLAGVRREHRGRQYNLFGEYFGVSTVVYTVRYTMPCCTRTSVTMRSWALASDPYRRYEKRHTRGACATAILLARSVSSHPNPVVSVSVQETNTSSQVGSLPMS